MEHKITFGNSSIVFTEKTDGIVISEGAICDFKVMHAPVFSARIKDLHSGESIYIDSSEGFKYAKILSGEQLLLSLADHKSVKGISFLISCRKENDSLVFDTEVENRSDNFSVMDVSYPAPVLSCGEFDVFYPSTSGRVAKNAGKNGLRYNNIYPHHHAYMQYFAVYNNKGGLYIGLEDTRAATKKFNVTAKDDNVCFKLFCCAPNGNKAKNSFKLFGECRWKIFSGDWYEASKIYSRFVEKNCDWLPALGENGRNDLSQDFSKIPFWVADYIPNTPYQRENKPMNLSAGSDIYSPDYWKEAVTELKNKLEVPIAYHVYNWHEIPFNIEYPHFLPAKDAFLKGAKELRRQGIYILPYINSVSWEMRDGEAGHKMNFENTGRHGAAITEDGEYFADHYPQTTASGHTSELVPMCPQFKPWRDYIRNLSARMLNTLPIDGIYFDEIAAHCSELCCNDEHTHPSYGGSYWADGYREMMEEINSEKPEGKYYFTECNAEPYIKSFDGLLTWMWLHGDQVPAFSAVYAGYVQLIGRCTIGRKKNDFEFFKFSVAQCLHYGQVMGWCKADIVYDDQYIKFLKPFVTLRYKYCDFFRNAQMLKPPIVTCGLEDKVTGPALWFEEDVPMPQVEASLWRCRKDGKTMLFLTNISEEHTTAQVTLYDGTQLKFNLNPYDCRGIEII